MKNASLDINVTERCSTGGCPLEEACEHCYLIQSAISVAISYIISVYCEDYAGYFTVILSFLAFHFCYAYFIYLVSCNFTVGACWSRTFWVSFGNRAGENHMTSQQRSKHTKTISAYSRANVWKEEVS
jgi:hypothetical protein